MHFIPWIYLYFLSQNRLFLLRSFIVRLEIGYYDLLNCFWHLSSLDFNTNSDVSLLVSTKKNCGFRLRLHWISAPKRSHWHLNKIEFSSLWTWFFLLRTPSCFFYLFFLLVLGSFQHKNPKHILLTYT